MRKFTDRIAKFISGGFRYRAVMFWHFLSRGHWFARQKIRRFYRENKTKKIVLGCGEFPVPGWLNADIISGDIHYNAVEKSPFPSGSADFFLTEQFIEHLTYHDAFFHLKEIARILKKGGVLRLSTPDLEKLIGFYMGTNPDATQERMLKSHYHPQFHKPAEVDPTLCEIFNDFFRAWGHQFVYDYEALKKLLLRAGFTDVKRVACGRSEFKELCGVEMHDKEEWAKAGLHLYLEATK